MLLAIKRTDGGISIMNVFDDANVDDEIEKWSTVHVNEYVSHKSIDPALIPSDRTFRNAWKEDLTVDMVKARTIHMDRIRVVRDKELEKLDIETLKGKDVQAQKQKLRDIPQTFDLSVATTPNELKALWPTELPKPV